MRNPETYHLSASSIASFKACPNRFRLAYREGLRPARDTESQRVGTKWHAMHEEYATARDLGLSPPEAINAACDFSKAEIPMWVTAEEWALEREILVRSFRFYHWYWNEDQGDSIEHLASEVPFNLPLHMPRTGLPLNMTDVKRVGKIDHIIQWRGAICVLERKSTSKGITAESDYWERGKKDTQVSMYALAFRDLHSDLLQELPIFPIDRIGGCLYDVWHKPTLKPSLLTQAETKCLIATGDYAGETFQVYYIPAGEPEGPVVLVGGVKAEIHPGVKGFAVRETPAMFGARLAADMRNRPGFYFQRREIVRTDAELTAFRKELYAIYQAQKAYEKAGSWFSNESQCRATYPCPFIPVCYGPGADAVCDGKTTPDGFKRLFVDVTVNNTPIEE